MYMYVYVYVYIIYIYIYASYFSMVLGVSPPLPLYPKTAFPPHQQTQLFHCYSLGGVRGVVIGPWEQRLLKLFEIVQSGKKCLGGSMRVPGVPQTP